MSAENQLIIMAFSSWFLPGYKAGGPIRVLANIIQHLEQDFCFKVVTRDRDLGDEVPFAGIQRNGWNKVGDTAVKYLGPKNRSLWGIRNTIRKGHPDVIYLNSFFDPALSLMPLLLSWLRLIPRRTPLVIAPRGEFAPAALAIKTQRKAPFLRLAKIIGLCKYVIWQAGSEHEELDIRRIWGGAAQVVIAPDLPPRLAETDVSAETKGKIAGMLRAVFLSRVAPIKNLAGALQMLTGVTTVVELDIYGPMEDSAYWETCRQIIARLPANITVCYHGPIANSEVAGVFSRYDLLYLPTLGESFGHVILEALLAGCPVLISDQTPWQGLEERKAGWVVSLDDTGHFQDILQCIARMDAGEYLPWSQGARRCGVEFSSDQSLIEITRNLFRQAIDSSAK